VKFVFFNLIKTSSTSLKKYEIKSIVYKIIKCDHLIKFLDDVVIKLLDNQFCSYIIRKYCHLTTNTKSDNKESLIIDFLKFKLGSKILKKK